MDSDTTNMLSKNLTSKISKQQWSRNAKHNKGIMNRTSKVKFLREPTSLTSFHDNPTKLIHKEMSTRIVGTISYSSKNERFLHDSTIWSCLGPYMEWHWRDLLMMPLTPDTPFQRENYNNTEYKYVPKPERKLHGQRPTKTVWHLLLKKTVGAHGWTQAYNQWSHRWETSSKTKRETTGKPKAKIIPVLHGIGT